MTLYLRYNRFYDLILIKAHSATDASTPLNPLTHTRIHMYTYHQYHYHLRQSWMGLQTQIR
jgi:hypothetical protein